MSPETHPDFLTHVLHLEALAVSLENSIPLAATRQEHVRVSAHATRVRSEADFFRSLIATTPAQERLQGQMELFSQPGHPSVPLQG